MLGNGAVVARAVGGRTVIATARAASPLRLLRPSFPGTNSAAICVITFGGGLVDGDRVELDIEVEAGATLLVFTQSPTKVFRGASSQTVRAKVDGALVWLPDAVAAFGSARYTQRVDVDLGPKGACVLLDGFTAGRAAYGERWMMEALDLRTSITRAGRAIVTDALRLDEVDGSIADRAGPYDAFATLIAVGEGAQPVIAAVDEVPIAPPNGALAVAASPLPRARSLGVPGAILRACASRPIDALAAVRARLRNLPEMDAVDPFASRY